LNLCLFFFAVFNHELGRYLPPPQIDVVSTLVCRSADEEVPFCYGVALVQRDYCSLPVKGTSPAAAVGGTASIMAATVVAVAAAVMFA